MRAYGSDRVRPAEAEGAFILECRIPKPGWEARVPKTLTTAEFPGTAILWNDEYYEVVEAREREIGVQYLLAPWPEQHMFRQTNLYDEPSEQARVAEHTRGVRRGQKRTAARLSGILLGHMPAAAQEAVASELGVSAPRLTITSLILPILAIIVIGQRFVAHVLDQRSPSLPGVVTVLGGFFFLETAIRFLIAWSQSRPIGSVIGFLVYTLLFAIRPRSVPSPFVYAKGNAVTIAAAPPEQRLTDMLKMREPFLTLLSAAEQDFLARRFGYDYRRESRGIAFVLLFFGVAGTVSSWLTLEHEHSGTALISLIVAGGVSVEQVLRLMALGRGPAGSLLGFAVRPFVKELLR